MPPYAGIFNFAIPNVTLDCADVNSTSFQTAITNYINSQPFMLSGTVKFGPAACCDISNGCNGPQSKSTDDLRTVPGRSSSPQNDTMCLFISFCELPCISFQPSPSPRNSRSPLCYSHGPTAATQVCRQDLSGSPGPAWCIVRCRRPLGNYAHNVVEAFTSLSICGQFFNQQVISCEAPFN